MNVEKTQAKTARDYAKDFYANGMGCNCDLDKWQPERSTGHSFVCRIHKAAIQSVLTAPTSCPEVAS